MANGFVFQAAFGLGDVPTTFSGCLSLRQHAFYGIDDGLGLRVDFNVDAVACLAAAEQGALQGFGDKVDVEFIRAHVADGEAASV